MDFILQFPGMSSIFFCCMTSIFPFSMVECCIFWYSYKYFWALFWETVIWKPFDLFEISFRTLWSRTLVVLTGRWLFSSTVECPCALGTFILWRKRTQTWDSPPPFLLVFLSLFFGDFFTWVLSPVFSWGFEMDCQLSVLFHETFSSLQH